MKPILLDTHTVIWFFNGSPSLSETAKRVILDPTNRVNVGKLTFAGGVAGFLKLIDSNGFQFLNITPKHLSALERLPLYHRDPFDRILIATAISEGMDFVTADKDIPLYPLQCMW